MSVLRLISIIVGAALGWIVVEHVIDVPAIGPRAGAILSECSGEMRELAIQYVAGNDDVLAAYRSFLPQLSSGVVVSVLCPAREDFDELVRSVGSTECGLRPVITGHPITCWSRDRWIALAPDARGVAVTLVRPRGEAGADVLPARKGDEQSAHALAGASSGRILARRSGLYFDAGDFLADDHTVFVAASRVERINLNRSVPDRASLVDQLTRLFRRDVVMIDDAPDHHLGMFMMALPGRRMLVADPSLAGAQASEARLAFDRVAEQVASAGYRVVRIPVVVPPDGRAYLTWVNVLMDFPPDSARPIVYMPAYRSAELFNKQAESIWTELGFDVRRVDCTTTFAHGGNLHCLVNVVRRD
jgi:hypothetical protein